MKYERTYNSADTEYNLTTISYCCTIVNIVQVYISLITTHHVCLIRKSIIFCCFAFIHLFRALVFVFQSLEIPYQHASRLR